MKLTATIAAVLAVTSNATALRSRSRVTAVSQADTALLEGLAAKYDCVAANGDLVQTLSNVVEANKAEASKLLDECTGFKASSQKSWQEALRSYETETAEVEPDETSQKAVKVQKGNEEFAAMEKKYCIKGFQQGEYEGCGTAYGTEVAPQKAAKDKADLEAADADDAYTKAREHYEAQVRCCFSSVALSSSHTFSFSTLTHIFISSSFLPFSFSLSLSLSLYLSIFSSSLPRQTTRSPTKKS